MARHHTALSVVTTATDRASIFELPSEAWMKDAVCTQVDPEAFFPEKGGDVRGAKKVCANCPVTAECLQYAIDNAQYSGVWGGASAADRRRMRGGLG